MCVCVYVCVCVFTPNVTPSLAYIEFWEKESVQKAISLNGCELGGYPISIQVTQSEQEKSSELPDIAMKLYVGNLHPSIGEEDLRPMFEAFGPLDGSHMIFLPSPLLHCLHRTPVARPSVFISLILSLSLSPQVSLFSARMASRKASPM